MKIKSIKSVKNLKNKRVIMRCDFDVQLKNGKIVDDTRLKACLSTIKYLLKKKAKVVLIGHLGRPGGKVDKKLSLMPVKKWMENKNQELRIKNQGIYFIKDINKITDNCSDYKICLLENLRFYPGEEKNDKKFAKNLAKLGDIYVNEAFGNSHRLHSSMNVIQNYLPSFAGLHLENEIKNLSYVLQKPKKPLIIVIGGAKIETKLPIINQFINKADYILIGGAVANVFFKAEKYEVGKSIIDNKYLADATKILKNKKSKTHIVLPVDVVVTGGNNKTLNEIKKNEMILDIGTKTRILFSGIIKSGKTIVWNGPMGNFEDEKFAAGTNIVANAILENKKAKSVVGGGETIQVVKESSKNIFISTGGGAMLEYLGGKKLPGLKKIIK